MSFLKKKDKKSNKTQLTSAATNDKEMKGEKDEFLTLDSKSIVETKE